MTSLCFGSRVVALGASLLAVATVACGGGGAGQPKTADGSAAVGSTTHDGAPASQDGMVTADTNTTRDAAAVIPDAGRDGPTMLSGVKATFTIGTAKSTTACESGKASVYVASSMMWSLSCNGNGARLTLGGPGPSKGMLTDPKNHEFVLSNDMGAVVSGLPTTMKLNVTTWDLVTTHFVGDLQAHWNAAGGKPAADLDVTFDVNLN